MTVGSTDEAVVATFRCRGTGVEQSLVVADGTVFFRSATSASSASRPVPRQEAAGLLRDWREMEADMKGTIVGLDKEGAAWLLSAGTETRSEMPSGVAGP